MKKLCKLVLALFICFSLVACSNGGEESKDAKYKVGVLQLIKHDALDLASQGFMDTLKEKLGDDVEFDFQEAAGEVSNCGVIANTFVTNGYDLIMANATPAVQACVSATDSIPIVGTSVTDYESGLNIKATNGALGINATGVSDLAPDLLQQHANAIKELFPTAKTVGVLFCSNEANSQFQVESITPLLEKNGFKVVTRSFSDSNDIQSITTDLCKECDVIYLPTDNAVASYSPTINNVAINANVPCFTAEEGTCKEAGCFTITVSYYEIGKLAGEMAYRILVEGADPKTMPIEYSTNLLKEYNPSICEALNVTVPSDYVAIK